MAGPVFLVGSGAGVVLPTSGGMPRVLGSEQLVYAAGVDNRKAFTAIPVGTTHVLVFATDTTAQHLLEETVGGAQLLFPLLTLSGTSWLGIGQPAPLIPGATGHVVLRFPIAAADTVQVVYLGS